MPAFLYDVVVKTGHFALAKFAILNGTQYGTAAGGAKVYGQEKSCFAHGGLKFLMI